ncbi:phosphohistidine phosphatase SixA [Actinobacillus arthritidis]|uniref:phosphohistidine phosphatase SixA n=1 Tax=Actinobacillus arthritidis TaxID=157339 RepID=UPI002442C749|nr:phosphohistidine phosphatase SixA [Actinobacillus arthritidis]WGE89632.1 phosphohistidine phosphatase SixA [Actinobacillus arthritidis]
MNIWVMRHGEAGFNALTDSERSLTENGRKMALEQGIWLAERLMATERKLDKVIVSPFIRAKQTFEYLLQGVAKIDVNQEMCIKRHLEIWDGITPEGNLENVLNYLDFLRAEGATNILMISHLPLVYDLVSNLTMHQDSVHFYPAVIAELEWTTNLGKITLVKKL